MRRCFRGRIILETADRIEGLTAALEACATALDATDDYPAQTAALELARKELELLACISYVERS